MRPIVALAFFTIVACASSSENRLPYGDDDSQADAASFSAGNINFRKNMPKHEEVKPWEFYFKHCSINGNEGFDSKTAYDCTGPAF